MSSTITRKSVSILASLICLAAAAPAGAGTPYWTPGGTDVNWSDPGNWIGGTGTGGVPGPNDSVVFGAAGTASAAFYPSNYVDSVSGDFAGAIGSLQYTNISAFQNTFIAPGLTLSVTNATSAIATVQAAGDVFLVGGAGAGTSGGATISGSQASLMASNAAAQFIVSQPGTAALLNLSNLDTLVTYASRVGVGVPPNYGWGVITAAEGGTFIMAKSNYISTSFSMAPGVTTSYTNWTGYVYVSGHEIEEAIEVGNGADNSIGAASSVLMGLTNGFYVDSMGVGKSKSAGSAAVVMKFNPVFTNQNPTAYIRGTNGSPTGRVAFLAIGDNATGGSSSSGAGGTLDFSGGSVDAMVDSLFLGIDKNGNTSTSTLNSGVLTFTSGNINVNLLTAGAQESPSAANNEACVGTVNVNGAGAVLTINNFLELGHTSLTAPTGTAPARTSGALNITSGAAYVNNIITGALSTNNSISVNGGSLIVSNTLATNAGLARLGLTNATVALNIPAGGLPVGWATNLATGGTTNIIDILSVPVFSSYPQQIKLIKYASLTGSGYNFGFGANVLPPTAPNAYLTNSGSSIDLVLPDDPRPVIALPEPASYSGTPGDNVSFTVLINPASVTPLSYQWYYYNGGATNPVANGTTGDGAVISGATNAVLEIQNGQLGENGNYYVVVNNTYGSATSSVAVLNLSAGCVQPSVTGPTGQTVITGNNATFTASVSANPAATISWTRNGVTLPGANSSSLTVTNAQYPGDDQAVYCIIATNACGGATNCATLSVIVAPTITNQPVSLVVTNGQQASFLVVAGGVPAPSYQWNFGGSPISGAGNSSALTANLVISSVSPANAGSYSVTVSNAAGVVVSTNVTLTVNSASLAIASTSPANGQSGVCYDTPLAITFNQAPSVGSSGKVRIYNTANPSTPVDTIDMGLGALQGRTVGGISLNTYAVIINGNVATVYPHAGVLTFNQSYYVTIDNGAFLDASGANYPGLTNTSAWTFTTKPTGPANSTNLVVAADGSGDFLTVQGAIDSVPANNTTPTAINIGIGTFTEVVRVNTKNNISFIGQSRQQTIVAYPNNNNINGASSTRPSFGLTSANDCSVQNLTITNSTPHGGSQAEALYINSSKRFICLNANVDSYQDTILCNAAGDQEYIQDSHVQGDVDFIWGEGTLYATNCELTSMTSGGHLTQPRTEQGYNGLAFINCLIDGAPGVTGSDLGRDAANSGNGDYYYGQDAYINCAMDTSVIIPAGWILGSGTLQSDTTFLRFWEFDSVDLSGNPVNTSSRVPWSTEIDGSTATNDVQNVSAWFSGWIPALAPNIIGQPQNLSVAGGATAQFSVGATGIPAANYQWYFDGNPVGGNSQTYNIAAANANYAGTYTVVVSNPSGAVTSSSATLTVGNTAPTLAPVSSQTVNVGANVTANDPGTDPDVPAQTLTYSLLSGPLGAAINSANGAFTWRPTVSAANSTNVVQVAVTDNGSPNLSATNSFNIIVNPLTQPNVSAPSYSAGQFSLSVSGEVGPDYALQVSTNLASGVWVTLIESNSPPSPFTFTDTNAAGTQQFYRIIVGPPLP